MQIGIPIRIERPVEYPDQDADEGKPSVTEDLKWIRAGFSKGRRPNRQPSLFLLGPRFREDGRIDNQIFCGPVLLISLSTSSFGCQNLRKNSF